MLKLIVYIPAPKLETVKQALFQAGAGRIGQYDCCSWQCEGTGQFRPLPGSNPHIGEQEKIETVSEWRVEMVLEKAVLSDVIAALKQHHPYETPAYQVLECLDV